MNAKVWCDASSHKVVTQIDKPKWLRVGLFSSFLAGAAQPVRRVEVES